MRLFHRESSSSTRRKVKPRTYTQSSYPDSDSENDNRTIEDVDLFSDEPQYYRNTSSAGLDIVYPRDKEGNIDHKALDKMIKFKLGLTRSSFETDAPRYLAGGSHRIAGYRFSDGPYREAPQAVINAIDKKRQLDRAYEAKSRKLDEEYELRRQKREQERRLSKRGLGRDMKQKKNARTQADKDIQASYEDTPPSAEEDDQSNTSPEESAKADTDDDLDEAGFDRYTWDPERSANLTFDNVRSYFQQWEAEQRAKGNPVSIYYD